MYHQGSLARLNKTTKSTGGHVCLTAVPASTCIPLPLAMKSSLKFQRPHARIHSVHTLTSSEKNSSNLTLQLSKDLGARSMCAVVLHWTVFVSFIIWESGHGPFRSRSLSLIFLPSSNQCLTDSTVVLTPESAHTMPIHPR